MKLIVVVFLAFAAQSHAETKMNSSEESSIQPSYNAQKDLIDMLMATAMDSYSQWQSPASLLPEAKPYKMKVTQRMENSSGLSSMPHLKERLYTLADQKLENCLTPSGQELDRHCVGRAMGQIMQFIAAIENSSPYTAYTGDRRSLEN